MSATVCRVCLVNNMKLYDIRNDLQNVYERFTREKYNKVGYPVHMCYICLTVLRKSHRFMETARDTNNVLKQWYKQQNEMGAARPLYTYSISKAELVSTPNDSISLEEEVKVEKVESEKEEVQTEYGECNTDVNIEMTDIDEQTDYGELFVDSPTDNTYIDTVEGDSNQQTDPLLNNNIGFGETSSLASNMDGHTNIETPNKMISTYNNDAPPTKKRKANETKPQHQAPTTSTETAANSETSNDITLVESSPSQLDNIRHRNTKIEPDKNNRSSKETAKLSKIDKTVIQEQNEGAINIKRNRTSVNKVSLNASLLQKNEINTCNYKTTIKQNIKARRLKRNTHEKQFVCNICEYQSKKKVDLERHMRTHTGEKPFSCDICNYKCTQKAHLELHMRTHTGEKPFSCKICNYKCSVKSNLYKHMKNHHDEKSFSCDICDHKFAYKNVLEQHMVIHTGEKPFSCKICNYKCTQKAHLELHMRTHTGEKPFSCKICNYKCSVKSNLYKHTKNHHGEKSFSCDICDHKFASKNVLEQHLVIHTGEKPFSCKICNYKCARKSSLVIHIRSHTGEKPFACDICNYKCAQQGHLEKHKRSHTGEKPFSCEICNRKFAGKSNFVRHIRSHTGEKPFSCEICDHKCAQKAHLERHLRIHFRE